jgi:phage tail-like protein
MAEAAAPNSPAAATGGGWEDPYRAFHFKVEIEKTIYGSFFECSGIGVRVNVITQPEGGSPTVHRMPGAVDHASVTLRMGLTSSPLLWNWMETIVSGKDDPRNVSIIVLHRDGQTEAMRYDLIRAWPSEYCGAPLNASASELAIERLTLVYESLKRSVRG